MAASYLHKPGTSDGHCVTPCDHEECIQERFEAVQICKLCGKPIGYEMNFYFVFTTTNPNGWYEHAAFENCTVLEEC